MSFTTQQIELLSAPLSRSNVSDRQQAGRKLSYIESWHAIAEANRIFGFDGWSSETVECRAVSEKPRKIGSAQRDGWSVTYIARVRVTVFAGERALVREGVGSGHGIDADLGLAHESAIKEAESDAQKRSLRQFGNQFGLALYDKTQENVTDEQPAAPSRVEPQPRGPAAQPAPKKQETKDVAPKSTKDSDTLRDFALSTLQLVVEPGELHHWNKQVGTESATWGQMTDAAQKAVREAAKAKQASLRRAA